MRDLERIVCLEASLEKVSPCHTIPGQLLSHIRAQSYLLNLTPNEAFYTLSFFLRRLEIGLSPRKKGTPLVVRPKTPGTVPLCHLLPPN